MSIVPPSERFPGWYPDPVVATLERFWDGRCWTEQTRVGLSLDDYLGPIEPVLMALLSDSMSEETVGAQRISRE